jgi:hypothetical protein
MAITTPSGPTAVVMSSTPTATQVNTAFLGPTVEVSPLARVGALAVLGKIYLPVVLPINY